MKRHCNIALILLLLAMQAVSLLHAGQYGFDAHEHNGHVCDLYLHAEQGKCAASPSVVSVPQPHYIQHVAYGIPVAPASAKTHYRIAAPRAPPVIS